MKVVTNNNGPPGILNPMSFHSIHVSRRLIAKRSRRRKVQQVSALPEGVLSKCGYLRALGASGFYHGYVKAMVSSFQNNLTLRFYSASAENEI